LQLNDFYPKKGANIAENEIHFNDINHSF